MLRGIGGLSFMVGGWVWPFCRVREEKKYRFVEFLLSYTTFTNGIADPTQQLPDGRLFLYFSLVEFVKVSVINLKMHNQVPI